MLSASKQAIAQAALAPGPHAVVSADREGVIRETRPPSTSSATAQAKRSDRPLIS